jgi:peptide/nickel transport system substrate-binding protein
VATSGPNTSTLVVAVRNDPRSLNPLLLEGVTAYTFGGLLYSYLTTYDQHGDLVGDLALAVPSVANGGISADGRTLTFHLRRNAHWQDRAPVTSRDVAFTYRAIINPANNVPERYGYDVVSAAETPDPYTLVVRLKRRFSPIVSLFFGGDSNYPILPAHLLAKYPTINAVAFNASPVGSGPYRFARWERGDRIELDANDAYYAGKPHIAHLVLPVVPDDSTIIDQLRTGELSAGFFTDTSRVRELRALPNHRLVVTPVPYFYALGFNLDVQALGDRTVRSGIAEAIDNEMLARKITLGVDDARHATRGLFTWAYDPHVSTAPYDPEGAKSLLSRDGWIPGPDGIRVKNGKRLSLQLAFPVGSNVTTEMATAIATAERQIGVDVTLRQYDRKQFLSEDGPMIQGRYQLSLFDYQGTYDPDASWLLACDQRAPHGFNMAHYCNPPVDALLREGAASYDRASRIAAYRAVQRTIAVDLPYDFLCQISEVDVIPVNLGGFIPPLLSPFNFVANWYWKYATSGRS